MNTDPVGDVRNAVIPQLGSAEFGPAADCPGGVFFRIRGW